MVFDYLGLVLTFTLLILAAVIGAWIRRRLSPKILDESTKELTRFGVAMVVTLSSIVLALLLSASFTRFETRKTDINQIAAQIGVLDMMLGQYGPAAVPLRATLRKTVDDFASLIWQPYLQTLTPEEKQRTTANVNQFYRMALDLPAETALDTSIKTNIISTLNDLTQWKQKIDAANHDETGIALIAICIFWYFLNFMSFFLLAPVNRITVTILLACAFSVSLAFFLIFEHEVFGSGLISITPQRLHAALSP